MEVRGTVGQGGFICLRSRSRMRIDGTPTRACVGTGPVKARAVSDPEAGRRLDRASGFIEGESWGLRDAGGHRARASAGQ